MGKQSNVLAFRRYQLENVPNALRMLAEQIEAGDVDVNRVVVAIESHKLEDGSVNADYKAFGEYMTPHHAAGLLELAKLLVLGW